METRSKDYNNTTYFKISYEFQVTLDDDLMHSNDNLNAKTGRKKTRSRAKSKSHQENEIEESKEIKDIDQDETNTNKYGNQEFRSEEEENLERMTVIDEVNDYQSDRSEVSMVVHDITFC